MQTGKQSGDVYIPNVDFMWGDVDVEPCLMYVATIKLSTGRRSDGVGWGGGLVAKGVCEAQGLRSPPLSW